MNATFPKRIALMNQMYRLPSNETLTISVDVADRLRKFKVTLTDEVNEIDEIISLKNSGGRPLDVAVAIADLLGGCDRLLSF